MERYRVSYSFAVLGRGVVTVEANNEEDAKDRVRENIGPCEAAEHATDATFSRWTGLVVESAEPSDYEVSKGWADPETKAEAD
ncbi:MAG: hypothetical protein ACREC5_07800 [Thermoplasmata archaeon]